jgi:hypothetical protein
VRAKNRALPMSALPILCTLSKFRCRRPNKLHRHTIV